MTDVAPADEATAPSDAEAPTNSYDPAFTESDANIILQSSDGIRYRMSSYTLRTTSGFFRGMMTLPARDLDAQTGSDDVIVLGENSKTLGPLLRMVAGLEFKKWETLDELEEILLAAEKYDMRGPMSFARASICSPTTLERPLQVYAIAARYGWEEEAKIAATHTLNLPVHDDEYTAMFERVPSAYLLRLFRLYRLRRERFIELCSSDGRHFGISPACLVCSRGGILQEPLAHLMKSMALSLDKRLDGGQILEGTWKEWPESKVLICNRWQACGAALITHAGPIAASVAAILPLLPKTI